MLVVVKIILLLCIVLAVYLLLKSGDVYWKKRVEKWAEQEKLKLISFRGARFYEGPNKWISTENQTVLYVTVRDHNRKTRKAWLVFGKNMNPISAPDELIKVVWE